MQLTNGQNASVAEVLAGTDSKEKGLKFKQDGQSTFTAKGSDGRTYSFDVGSTIVRVVISERVDLKEARKQGIPIPKDKAKQVDEALKKQKDREDKVAKGEMTTEDAAKEAAKEEPIYAEEAEDDEEKKPEPSGLRGRPPNR